MAQKQKVIVSFTKLLNFLTGIDGWTRVTAPAACAGVDYWFKSGEHNAYINMDDESISISVDGELTLERGLNELPPNVIRKVGG